MDSCIYLEHDEGITFAKAHLILKAIEESFIIWEGAIPHVITEMVVGSEVQFQKYLSQVTKIDWFERQLSDYGVIVIAEALRVNPTVKELHLEANEIGDQGAMAIAEALKVNSVLRTLRLHSNQITNNGVIKIAEALKVNSTLCTLNFDNNRITDNGAMALAEALKVNATVTKVYLRNNLITDVKVVEEAVNTVEVLKSRPATFFDITNLVFNMDYQLC